jgi:outer membrane immunogenic protein
MSRTKLNLFKMKKLLLSAVLLCAFGLSYSQSPLPVGQAQVNFGLGISGWGVPVYVGLDYSILRDVTIGGELSYRSYRDDWGYYYYNQRIIGISGNGNYHFNTLLHIPRKYDFYAGANLGVYIWNSPSDYHGPNNTGIGVGAQVGGRYYFSKRGALNLELGGGNVFSDGKIGLSFKL